jgi:hypothetical protein
MSTETGSSARALGGLIYTVSPTLVAAICACLFVCAIVFVTLTRVEGLSAKREPPTLASALAGFAFIRHNERLLGIITLDLFVVLLGGVTTLLPIFAKDILQSGPIGLGLLRSAPAVGAVPPVLIGGIGSFAVAGFWMLFFPSVRRIDRFQAADKET